MYILILSYTNGLRKIERYLAEHRTFLDKYYALNKFVCSGPQKPRNGGIIICNSNNMEEVKRIIAEDPFYIHNAASYKIIEFEASKYAPAFEAFL